MVDFIKTEQKLLKAQLNLIKTRKQTEMLSKLDRHINKIKVLMPEKVLITLKGPEALSSKDKLELPLKVRGKVLGVGRHKVRYYTEEELKKSVKNENVSIPFKVDHRRNETSATIGKVYRIYWDDVDKVVKYEAHINDETQARNILDGVVKEVSASIFSTQEYDERLGIIGTDLEYGEISAVEDGAYKGKTLKAVV